MGVRQLLSDPGACPCPSQTSAWTPMCTYLKLQRASVTHTGLPPFLRKERPTHVRRKADLRSRSPEPMASVYEENEVMGVTSGCGGTRRHLLSFPQGSRLEKWGGFSSQSLQWAASHSPPSSHSVSGRDTETASHPQLAPTLLLKAWISFTPQVISPGIWPHLVTLFSWEIETRPRKQDP